MSSTAFVVTILIVDDDADDRLLIEDAFCDCGIGNSRQYLFDGEQLMHYLKRRSNYTNAARFPMPGLILLDLNMPRKDGRESLREIRSDPALQHIPVVVANLRNLRVISSALENLRMPQACFFADFRLRIRSAAPRIRARRSAATARGRQRLHQACPAR